MAPGIKEHQDLHCKRAIYRKIRGFDKKVVKQTKVTHTWKQVST